MFSCILHGWSSHYSMCPICQQSQERTTAGDSAIPLHPTPTIPDNDPFKERAVGFADFIKADYSPIEDLSGWILNGNNYKKGDIPNITVYTTSELFDLFTSNKQSK